MPDTATPVPVPMATFARQVAEQVNITPATTGGLGMVKPGTGLLVAEDGTLTPDFGTEAGTVADGGALNALTEQVNQIPAPGLPAIAGALGFGILNYAQQRSATSYYMGNM